MISITSLSIGTSSQLNSTERGKEKSSIPGVVVELAGCSKQPMYFHFCAYCALMKF